MPPKRATCEPHAEKEKNYNGPGHRLQNNLKSTLVILALPMV